MEVEVIEVGNVAAVQESTLPDFVEDVGEAKETRFRFRPYQDILLLRQVYDEQPFAAAHGQVDQAWCSVARSLRVVKITAPVKSIRDRFYFLKKKFEQDEMASLRKTGTNEEYEEREHLLTSICELINSTKALAKEKKAAKDSDADKGKLMRETAMLSLQKKKQAGKDDTEKAAEEETDTKESKIKRRKTSLVGIMAQKEERRGEIENSRLVLDKEKLLFDQEKLRVKEKKIELDAQLREKELEHAAKSREEDRKQQSEFFRAQMQVMMEIAKAVCKTNAKN